MPFSKPSLEGNLVNFNVSYLSLRHLLSSTNSLLNGSVYLCNGLDFLFIYFTTFTFFFLFERMLLIIDLNVSKCILLYLYIPKITSFQVQAGLYVYKGRFAHVSVGC